MEQYTHSMLMDMAKEKANDLDCPNCGGSSTLGFVNDNSDELVCKHCHYTVEYGTELKAKWLDKLECELYWLEDEENEREPENDDEYEEDEEDDDDEGLSGYEAAEIWI